MGGPMSSKNFEKPVKKPETVTPPVFLIEPVQKGLFEVDLPEHADNGDITLFGCNPLDFLVVSVLID